jgi:formate transporter
MSYLEPTEFVTKMVDQGESKVYMSTKDTLIRAFMAGAILALAAVFAITVATKTGSPLVGAILFPVGFIMLYLMKFDLLTGVFTLVPLALLDRRPGVTINQVFRNWGLVFIGNFAGALAVAFMMSFILTYGYTVEGGVIAEKVSKIGEARTLGYKAHGMGGWFTIFIRGMLCNWMVSMGVVGAMISTSATGKMMAMWMPIMLFFFMGFEHSIVNMFLFPFSMIMGGNFTFMEYIIWNELPTALGNLVGGFVLVGLPLYFTHVRTSPERVMKGKQRPSSEAALNVGA